MYVNNSEWKNDFNEFWTFYFKLKMKEEAGT